MAKKASSIEEQVEDWCKQQLLGTKYYTKTEAINPEIEEALRKAPSKKGGSGTNFPDIKCFIETSDLRRIPVMIEVKGTKGDFVKADIDNIENKKKDGEPNYTNISKYAVNGAIHYAHAILNYTDSYKEVVAIGVNGYAQSGKIFYEIGVYYVSKDNLFMPKRVGSFNDLSFLLPNRTEAFVKQVDELKLTEKELESKRLELEDDIERKLKTLNQKMHDEQRIDVKMRVQLVAGLIMAGLGVPGKVAPLKVEDLRGESGAKSNDGRIVMNKIDDYLTDRGLPQEKKEIVINELSKVFIHSKLNVVVNGESTIHSLYKDVKQDILPFLTGELHNIDFTGRLFNVLNEWVDVPDGDKNDVVLTPRYVTQLMARLCKVNMDSYVWDFATGSAGFLISAMHLMIDDANKRLNGKAKDDKVLKIKMEQLLGIERLIDIYLLAVLNMILMKDGSANIIHGDSLLEFEGKYEQGSHKGEVFPANVFLLNPPYSAEGKGFVFVERALGMMNHGGRAAVLIQENAGSGNGLPYTANILKNNTLIASIKMSDIFCGKASVQTAIYVFEVGVPHEKDSTVKFIDFSNDGYTRQNRKKSSQSVNLRDTDNAEERYDEVVRIVNAKGSVNGILNYLKGCYVEDQITLNGNDWTYGQHQKYESIPTEEDFQKVVKDYLTWKVSEVEVNEGENGQRTNDETRLKVIDEGFITKGGKYIKCKASELFVVKGNPQLNKDNFNFGPNSQYPYFTRTAFNNGILGYVDFFDQSHLIKGNSLAVGMIGMQFFYMKHDFYAGQFTKTVFPKFDGFNEIVALWFISWFNKSSKFYQSLLVRDFEKAFNNTELIVPFINHKVAVKYIEERVLEIEGNRLRELEDEHARVQAAYRRVIALQQSVKMFHLYRNDEISPRKKYAQLLPVFSVRAVCGYFEENVCIPEEMAEGWVDISKAGVKANKNMFLVHAVGDSMKPKINNGDLCLFELYGTESGGSREGEIVLTQLACKDNDYDCSYTIKKYFSQKEIGEDNWQHTKVQLLPLNPEYNPIVLSPDEDGEYRTIGILKAVL